MAEPTLQELLVGVITRLTEVIDRHQAVLDELDDARSTLSKDLETAGYKLFAGLDNEGYHRDLEIEAGSIALNPQGGHSKVARGVFPDLLMAPVSNAYQVAWADDNGRVLLVSGSDDAQITLDGDAPSVVDDAAVYHVVGNFSNGTVQLIPPGGQMFRLIDADGEVILTDDEITLGYGFTTVIKLSDEVWGVS